MQRSLWKGAISFGLVHIPVHLYAAESSNQLDLDMLDRRDFGPIGYQRINKQTGRTVEWSNIVKGFEYEPGQYVVLSDEDLKRANVKATGTIDILSFVDADEVAQIYFERPYYLTPDKGGDKVYALLRETLRRANRIAIAQIVLRTKQHLAALFAMDDMIVLNTLRYADEIRAADEYNVPAGNLKQVGIGEKEIQMALSLVEGMTEHWQPSQYHDTYRDDVMATVQKKIKANQTRTVTEPEEEVATPAAGAQIIDLMGLLKQSLGAKAGKAVPTGNGTKTSAKKSASSNGKGAATGKSGAKRVAAKKSSATNASADGRSITHKKKDSASAEPKKRRAAA